MKTLEQFNEDRRKEHESWMGYGKPHPNGIACPACGKELWDSAPNVTLTSNPPQKSVHCKACNYTGLRVA